MEVSFNCLFFSSMERIIMVSDLVLSELSPSRASTPIRRMLRTESECASFEESMYSFS